MKKKDERFRDSYSPSSKGFGAAPTQPKDRHDCNSVDSAAIFFVTQPRTGRNPEHTLAAFDERFSRVIADRLQRLRPTRHFSNTLHVPIVSGVR